MTEKKTRAAAGGEAAAGQPGSPLPPGPGQEPAGRMDQLGAIVAKGFDLLDAGITLGIRLATRLTAALQEQTLERSGPAGPPYPEPAPPPAYPPPVGGPPPLGSPPPPAPVSYVTNRLPLFPGSPVHVSFTINNDSASLPRDLHLHVEGLAGERHGGLLDGAGFAVEPPAAVIAPLDFEKFVLTGAIPPDAAPDGYAGWIVVSAQEQLRIPVRLVVAARP